MQNAILKKYLGERARSSLRPLTKLVLGPSNVRTLLDEGGDAKSVEFLEFVYAGISDHFVVQIKFSITQEWVNQVAKTENIETKKIDSLDSFSHNFAPTILKTLSEMELSVVPKFSASATPLKSIVSTRIWRGGESQWFKNNCVEMQLHGGNSTTIDGFFGNESEILCLLVCQSPYDLNREILEKMVN